MEIILAVVISFVLTALMGKALIPALVKLRGLRAFFFCTVPKETRQHRRVDPVFLRYV